METCEFNENDNFVRVWEWEDAPEELKICNCGGDEDFLALVPPKLRKNFFLLNLFEEGTRFGCCSVVEKEISSLPGFLILVGCHS